MPSLEDVTFGRNWEKKIHEDDLQWVGGVNGREAHEGRYICILMADSHSCIAGNKHSIVKQLASN